MQSKHIIKPRKGNNMLNIYETIVNESKRCVRDGAEDIMKAYDNANEPNSPSLALRNLTNTANLMKEDLLKTLLRDIKNEYEEMQAHLLVGDLESIRGNVEALKCIHSNITDLIGVV